MDLTSPVISTWDSSWRGLEALAQPHAVLLGLALVGLTVILGCLYLLNNIDDTETETQMRRTIKITAIPFLVIFLVWLGILLTREGFAVDASGTVTMEKYKYLHNLIQMPAVLIMVLLGVVGVLASIWMGGFTKSTKGIWFGGLGTVLVVMSVFFIAGFNGTSYYPSLTDLQSSLTIRNSSSSQFTLQVMSIVSLLIPLVLAYIVYAWRQMDKKKITEDEIAQSEHKY
jgi:cytochrome d ubiquinol oxidase subunit II